jgi:hypothetical protein
VAYVRTVKTSSGATPVQIVWSSRRGSRSIEHLGSAHDEAGLAALKAAVLQRLAAGQTELDLDVAAVRIGEVDALPPVIVLERWIVPGQWRSFALQPAIRAGAISRSMGRTNGMIGMASARRSVATVNSVGVTGEDAHQPRLRWARIAEMVAVLASALPPPNGAKLAKPCVSASNCR